MTKVALFLTMCAGAAAQAPGTSSISGRVTDSENAVVPRAAVTLVETRGGIELKTTTNSAGQYIFSAVLAGVYDVRVDAAGFGRASAGGLKADVGRSVVQDFSLQLAAVQSSVDVSAAAAPLNLDDSAIATVLTGEIIRRLPNLSRSAVTVLLNQPGIHPDGSTNGARADQNSVILDGGDVSSAYGTYFGPSIAIPAEVTEEVRVVVSNPTASASRGSGAQFTFDTRRGSNAWHGSAYHYLQNDALNANNFVNNRLGFPRPVYRDNRGGASAGGRVVKDSTYWFAAFERRIRNVSQTVSTPVPSDSLRAGILRFRDSAGLVQTVDPKTVDPRGAGASPAILSILNRYPKGNDPLSGGADGLNTTGYTFVARTPSEFAFGLVRLDHAFSPKWRFDGSGRLSQNDFVNGGQLDLLARAATRLGNTYSRYVTGALTGLPAAGITSRTQYFWSQERWYNGGQTVPAIEPLNVGADFGGPFLGELIGTGNAQRWQRGRANYHSIAETLEWQSGKHRWQFGGTFRRVASSEARNNKFGSVLTNPTAAVGAALTTAVGAAERPAFLNTPDFRRYDVLYSTLLGVVDSVSVLGVRDGSLNALPLGAALGVRADFHETQFFAQDVWRARPSLNITYGLAYGWATPARESDGRQMMAVYTADGSILNPLAYLERKREAALASQVFNPGIGFAPLNSLNRRTIYDIDRGNWSPRISVAWNPTLFGSKDIVFRTGYGLLFDRTTIATMISQPSFAPGFAESYIVNPKNSAGLPFRAGVDGPIPAPSPRPATVPLAPNAAAPEPISGSIDPNLRTPYSHMVNFSVQRALPWSSTFEAAYVGRFARRLYQNININNFPYMFRDPRSGQTFAEAYDALAAQLRAGVAPSAVTPQPWFENMLPGTGTRQLAGSRGADIINGAVSSLALNYMNARMSEPLQIPGVQDFIFKTSNGRSNYHAAILTWNKRSSRGLTLTANYSYSKSLDQFGGVQEDASSAGDAFDLDRDYGPSYFDHRHMFSTMWLYELPFGGGRATSLRKRLVGGWWLSSIFFAHTGEPMSVYAGQGMYGGGLNLSHWTAAIPLAKPEFDNGVHRTAGSGGIGTAGDPSVNGTGLNRYADPAAMYRNFRYPRLSEDGRTGRGALRDFIIWNADLGVGKMTNITEKYRAGFSIEFQNVLNRVIWFNPSLELARPDQFGVLNWQWNAPRTVQAGLRIEW